MLSRIAHELFWLGRDLTRAEYTARILDGAFHADVAYGLGDSGVALSWDAVLAIIGAKAPAPREGAVEPVPVAASIQILGEEPALPGRPPLGRDEVARLLSLDVDSPASIVSCAVRGRQRARTIRDVISTEMWEALNAFYLRLRDYDEPTLTATGPYSFFQEVKSNCALFWGLTDRTMMRDESLAFLEGGRRIEEADMVLRMLLVAVPPGGDDGVAAGQAIALLHAVGGAQAFRRAVREAPTVGPVVSFLLYDSSYPGSVASAVGSLRDALAATDPAPRSSAPVLRLGRLIAELELQRRTPATGLATAEILQRVQDELALVDHDIGDRYFALAFAATYG